MHLIQRREGLNGLDHTPEEALWLSFPYLRRRSTLSASLLNSPQSGTFHYLSTFLHIHSIGLHRGKEGGRAGGRGCRQEKGRDREDVGWQNKNKKIVGMLVREVKIKDIWQGEGKKGLRDREMEGQRKGNIAKDEQQRDRSSQEGKWGEEKETKICINSKARTDVMGGTWKDSWR